MKRNDLIAVFLLFIVVMTLLLTVSWSMQGAHVEGTKRVEACAEAGGTWRESEDTQSCEIP